MPHPSSTGPAPLRLLPAPVLRCARGLLLALGGAAGLTGCLAGPSPEPEPWSPPPVVEPTPTGFFLVELDNRLLAWQKLKLEGRTKSDLRRLRGLERELSQQTEKRREELIDELASPSPKNRAVAAIALGFTGEPTVVGPLLAALGDSDGKVRNNALVGLGVLGNPTTPLARLCFILDQDPDPWTRNNAAFAIQAVLASGGEPDCALATCREALVDLEPGVRAQCASILGLLVDAASVEDLGDLVHDDVRLVSAAACAALANIGKRDPTVKGQAARALVDAIDRVEEDHREHVLFELTRMGGPNFGDDVAAWTEWAYKMP